MSPIAASEQRTAISQNPEAERRTPNAERPVLSDDARQALVLGAMAVRENTDDVEERGRADEIIERAGGEDEPGVSCRFCRNRPACHLPRAIDIAAPDFTRKMILKGGQ